MSGEDVEGYPKDFDSGINKGLGLMPGVYHFAFDCDSLESLDATQKRLQDHGVEVKGPVDHEGWSKSIYFEDPNGLQLECCHLLRAFNADDAIPQIRFRLERGVKTAAARGRGRSGRRLSASVRNASSARVAALPLDGLLERVRATVPLIAGRARDAERERKPADDVIEALEATGVFRSFVPKRFGGYEIGLDLFVDIGVTVSEACPSTGWITTFYMEHNWLLGLFSDELQQDVFGKAPYILAPGSVNPRSGNATPKGDGYELTGRWKFATGIVHADWVLLSAMVPADPNAGATAVSGAAV